ncbi:MAG TPA: TadE family protein [Gemmatimonadaceae bacterium]|nr:TadE family protein [Gemmatimonadaceae bacterium]
MRRLSLHARDEAGAAIIEFALVAPLLLVLVWGIIETGRAFYTINSLTSAVRDGARYGAAACPLGASPGVPDIVSCSGAIDSIVVRGFQPIGLPMEVNQVDVNVLGTGANTRIEVVGNYPYAPIVPVAGWQFTLTRRAVFRYERLP